MRKGSILETDPAVLSINLDTFGYRRGVSEINAEIAHRSIRLYMTQAQPTSERTSECRGGTLKRLRVRIGAPLSATSVHLVVTLLNFFWPSGFNINQNRDDLIVAQHLLINRQICLIVWIVD